MQGLHRAARVEDAVHEFLEPRLRQRGWRDTIIPYTGYGTRSWVRVMARLLLRRAERRPEGSRRFAAGAASRRSPSPTRSWSWTWATGSTRRGRIAAATSTSSWRRASNRAGAACGCTGEGAAPVEAPVRVLAPDMRLGVVSDIDDTVMVTALPRPLLAAWNTFVLDEHARSPVPGMAVLYERLATAHPARRCSTCRRGRGTSPHAHPLPVAQPVPAGAAAAHRLGPDARSLVPERASAQAGDLDVSRRSSRTSAGCSSATTGNTTRRSTATSSRRTPRTSPPWPSAAVRGRRCSPAACPRPSQGPSRPCGRAPVDDAPDGAGLARR